MIKKKCFFLIKKKLLWSNPVIMDKFVKEGIHIVSKKQCPKIFNKIRTIVRSNVNRYDPGQFVKKGDDKNTTKLGKYRLYTPYHCVKRDKEDEKCPSNFQFDCDKIKGTRRTAAHSDQKGFCVKDKKECRKAHDSTRGKYHARKERPGYAGIGKEHEKEELNKATVMFYTIKNQKGRKWLSGYLFGYEKIINKVPYFYVALICSSMRTGRLLMEEAEKFVKRTNKNTRNKASMQGWKSKNYVGPRHLFLYAAHVEGDKVAETKLLNWYSKNGFVQRVNACRKNTRGQRKALEALYQKNDGAYVCSKINQDGSCKTEEPFEFDSRLNKDGAFPEQLRMNIPDGIAMSKCMYKKTQGQACETKRTNKKGTVDGGYPRKRGSKYYVHQRCISKDKFRKKQPTVDTRTPTERRKDRMKRMKERKLGLRGFNDI